MMLQRTDQTQYSSHKAWYVAGFVAALLLFAGATALVLAGDGKAAGWERTWAVMIAGWPQWLYHPMAVATFVATPGIIAGISVAAAFFARYYRLAVRLTLSVFLAYGATYVLKDFFDRARPIEQFTDFHARVHETDAAFPSGHTTAVTVVVLTILPYLPRKWQWVAPVPILLVGLSRIYLGAHLPLDVVAGFAVSLGVVAFIRILPQSVRIALRID